MVEILQPLASYAMSGPQVDIYKKQPTNVNQSNQNYQNNGDGNKVWVPPVYKNDKVLVPETYKEKKEWVPETYQTIRKWVPETYHYVKEWVPSTYKKIRKWVPVTYQYVRHWIPTTYRYIRKWVPVSYERVRKWVPATYHYVREWVPTTYRYVYRYVHGYYRTVRHYVYGYYRTITRYVPSQIRHVWHWLWGKWRMITHRVGGYYRHIRQWVSGHYETYRTYVHGYYHSVRERIGGYFHTVVRRIGGYYHYITKRVGGYYKTLRQKIGGYYQTIKKKVGGYYHYVTQKIAGYYKTVKQKIGGFYKTVKHKVGGFYKTVKEKVAAYYKTVKKLVSKGYWKIKETKKEIEKHLSSQVKSTLSKVKEAITASLPSIGTIKTIAKTSLSGLQAVGGAVEVATGVALCSTGLGAIVGVPLILHGAADVVQGSLNTYNAARGNGKEAKNFMQEAYKWLGRKIGGEEGQKIANGVFTTVDIGLGFASVGGAVKLASKVEKIVTELKPGLIKGVFKATSSKASSIARTVKTELGQLAKHYNKQSGTMLGSTIAGEGQKAYDAVKGYLKEKLAKTGVDAGEAVSKGKVKGSVNGATQSTIDQIQKYATEGKTPAIGKMFDLNKSGAVSSEDFRVADLLPYKGNPQADWKQNSSVLRIVMKQGVPIKDVSPYPMQNAGFLGMERNLLRNSGWTYSGGYWYPAK